MTTDPAVNVAFDFGRRTADPDFREFLRTLGSARQRIIPATPDTPIGDILRRAEVNGTQSPFLVVVPDESARFGFRFLIGDVPVVGDASD